MTPLDYFKSLLYDGDHFWVCMVKFAQPRVVMTLLVRNEQDVIAENIFCFITVRVLMHSS